MSLVFEGILSLNKTKQNIPINSIIINETAWYRNLTRDIEATSDIYNKIYINSIQEIIGNSSEF